MGTHKDEPVTTMLYKSIEEAREEFESIEVDFSNLHAKAEEIALRIEARMEELENRYRTRRTARASGARRSSAHAGTLSG